MDDLRLQLSLALDALSDEPPPRGDDGTSGSDGSGGAPAELRALKPRDVN